MAETSVELQRRFTLFKMTVIPILTSIKEIGFFARFVFFCTVVYLFAKMAESSKDAMVVV